MAPCSVLIMMQWALRYGKILSSGAVVLAQANCYNSDRHWQWRPNTHLQCPWLLPLIDKRPHCNVNAFSFGQVASMLAAMIANLSQL